MARSRKTTKLATLLIGLLSALALGGSYRSITPLKVVSGTPGFDPTQLTGKIAIFIADSGNLSLSGSDVLTWTDLSGNSNTATGGTAKPVFNSSGLNAQGTITFQNVSPMSTVDFGTQPIFDTARGHSVYIVMKVLSFCDDCVFFTGVLNGAPDSPCYEWKNSGFHMSGNTSLGAGANKPQWAGITPGTSNFHSYIFTNNGSGYASETNSALYYDDVLQTVTTLNYAQWGFNNVIGSYQQNGSSGFSLPIEVAAVVVVDHEMSGTERTNMASWRLTKYGF